MSPTATRKKPKKNAGASRVPPRASKLAPAAEPPPPPRAWLFDVAEAGIPARLIVSVEPTTYREALACAYLLADRLLMASRKMLQMPPAPPPAA